MALSLAEAQVGRRQGGATFRLTAPLGRHGSERNGCVDEDRSGEGGGEAESWAESWAAAALRATIARHTTAYEHPTAHMFQVQRTLRQLH